MVSTYSSVLTCAGVVPFLTLLSVTFCITPSGGAYMCFIVIWEVATQIITIIINTYYFYQINTAFQPIILNEKLTAYVQCVTGFYQCGFRHTR